jgi:hypothetical protein
MNNYSTVNPYELSSNLVRGTMVWHMHRDRGNYLMREIRFRHSNLIQQKGIGYCCHAISTIDGM